MNRRALILHPLRLAFADRDQQNENDESDRPESEEMHLYSKILGGLTKFKQALDEKDKSSFHIYARRSSRSNDYTIFILIKGFSLIKKCKRPGLKIKIGDDSDNHCELRSARYGFKVFNERRLREQAFNGEFGATRDIRGSHQKILESIFESLLSRMRASDEQRLIADEVLSAFKQNAMIVRLGEERFARADAISPPPVEPDEP